MKIYTINDSKAAFYGQPFYARSNGEAIRTFEGAVRTDTPDNQLNKYPADFSLFEIGEFDEQTGKITAIDPKHLVNGLDFKQQ